MKLLDRQTHFGRAAWLREEEDEKEKEKEQELVRWAWQLPFRSAKLPLKSPMQATSVMSVERE
jgi:hypothetical protein